MSDPEAHISEPESSLQTPVDLSFDSQPTSAETTTESPAAILDALTAMGAKVEQAGSIEVLTADDPEALLDWAVSHQYVLHGTTRLIEGDFEPRTANDSAKESGNRTAIYMVDIPPIAMFKALTGGVNGDRTTHMGCRAITDEQGNRSYSEVSFATTAPELVAGQGFVYVFDADDADEHTGGEFLAYKPIRPLAVIKILREQFKYPIEHLQL